ncbi:BrnA antitoxin family protein [Bauldia litoralis]|uniref:Uncharacterized conserved protein, DUF4415 family n=1 Tax=Bauldia litoralis TaxID=665467 RepID=A0A1G6BYE3_9HYPH|nr:BrnA antitoxin family protein [Bauldia litoralis]SDB25652.1 Uncharacterized conserved protein, DUF4415 family [Bauldia litoralis]
MEKKKPDHISQEDWDAVDVPEWTDERFRRARPAHEVLPDIFPKPRPRGPQKTPTKVQTTIRLDSDVIAHFRSTGAGWQSRLNEMLRRGVAQEKKRAQK